MLKQFFGSSFKSIVAKIIFGLALFIIISFIVSLIFSAFGQKSFGYPFEFFQKKDLCIIGDNLCQIFNIYALIADIIIWYFISCVSTLIFWAKSINKILKTILCGLFVFGFIIMIIVFQILWQMYGFAGEGDYANFNQSCMPGLTKIADNLMLSQNACIPVNPTYYICTKCGDGVCGKGENVCNCPQDCKTKPRTVSPTPTTTTFISATPISGVAPLDVEFSGKINSKTWPSGYFVIDYGESQSNYCSVMLTGIRGSNIWNIGQTYHTYKSSGTYVASLRKGINCIYGGCVPCTPGQIIYSITINVK